MRPINAIDRLRTAREPARRLEVLRNNALVFVEGPVESEAVFEGAHFTVEDGPLG